MAGSPPHRPRRLAAPSFIAAVFLANGLGVLAQAPPLPQPGVPGGGYAGIVDATEVAPDVVAGPLVQPAYRPAPVPSMIPVNARVELGVLDTIAESLFGDNQWRPLGLDTFFSEGWLEPWAGGPAGQSGLTPRHGWLGSFEGVFYRLWLVSGTYQNNLNRPYGGNGYRGNFGIFLPFSRRFELFIDAPFVVANGTEDPSRGYRSDFGDMSIAGSFLLSESEAFTQLFTLGTIVPTGQTDTGGNLMTVFPRYSFWSNPGGAWVVRGGTGVNVVLNKNDQLGPPVFSPDGGILLGESTSQTAYYGDLAIGRYFTPHDVPFGDLVLYGNANVVVPLEDRNEPTYLGVGAGTRFQITGNWWFLNYWEVPVVGPRAFDFQMQAAIVKAY